MRAFDLEVKLSMWRLVSVLPHPNAPPLLSGSCHHFSKTVKKMVFWPKSKCEQLICSH